MDQDNFTLQESKIKDSKIHQKENLKEKIKYLFFIFSLLCFMRNKIEKI